MPNGLMMADANFPRFTGTESTEQKISTIQNYLFQLTEQLRWSYANIGKENFNETAYKTISEEIQGPVIRRYESLDLTVSGGEGNSASIQITGEGLKTEAKTIEFKGMVTFTDLETSGKTMINGDNIKTGTIKAINMDACEISGSNFYCTMDRNDKTTGDILLCYPNELTVVGGLQINNSGAGTTEESKKRIYLYATGGFALKLYSTTKMSLEAGSAVYVNGGNLVEINATRIRLNGAVYINDILYTPATV